MKTQRILQWILSAIAAASILFPIGYLFWGSSPWDVGGDIFLALLCGASLSPIVALWIFSIIIKSLVGRYILLVAALVAFGFGGFVYNDISAIQKDALNSLVFLFLPMWQNVGLGLIFWIILLVEHLRKKHSAIPPKN
jgi:hypothetical protein